MRRTSSCSVLESVVKNLEHALESMHHEGDLTVAEALIYAAICIFLTCLAGAICRRRTWTRMAGRNCRCSGTASGLTVGLLAIEPMNLKVIKGTGTDDEKRSTPALFPSRALVCKHGQCDAMCSRLEGTLRRSSR